MEGSWATTLRKLLAEIGGVVLLAGGLVALSAPVSLAEHDSWGVQVGCGNGYYSELLQAQLYDESSTRQSPSHDTTVAVRPATDWVHHCNSAIAYRRAWAMPMAGLGALILLAQLTKWTRAKEFDPEAAEHPSAEHAWSAEHPDDDMHVAQILDRQERSHREGPFEQHVVMPRPGQAV